VCIYVYINIHIDIRIFVFICMYVNIYTHAHTNKYAYTHTYICIYIHIDKCHSNVILDTHVMQDMIICMCGVSTWTPNTLTDETPQTRL